MSSRTSNSVGNHTIHRVARTRSSPSHTPVHTNNAFPHLRTNESKTYVGKKKKRRAEFCFSTERGSAGCSGEGVEVLHQVEPLRDGVSRTQVDGDAQILHRKISHTTQRKQWPFGHRWWGVNKRAAVMAENVRGKSVKGSIESMRHMVVCQSPASIVTYG